MGKLPGILLIAIALWVAWEVYVNGPDKAVGGLFHLLNLPQYGQADAPTRSGTIADEVLQEESPAPPPKDDE